MSVAELPDISTAPPDALAISRAGRADQLAAIGFHELYQVPSMSNATNTAVNRVAKTIGANSRGPESTGVENLVVVGEVHTGLLHHSSALSPVAAARLLDIVPGRRVVRSDRPLAQVRSSDELTGVDCLLPTAAGAKVRGVGTVVSHTVLTGGHVLQGSAYAQVRRSPQARRLPWSYYLVRPSVVETMGKADAGQLAAGFLGATRASGRLDLAAIAQLAMDSIQDQPVLDHRSPVRSARTRLRWVVRANSLGQAQVVYGIVNDVSRTVCLPSLAVDLESLARLCEDLALHDWLLTTLLSLMERSRIGLSTPANVVQRLRPAVDFLIHLWMPGGRVDQALLDVWEAVDHSSGFSRQWQANVDRLRDQLALAVVQKQNPMDCAG